MSTPETKAATLARLKQIAASLNDTSPECLSALDNIRIIELELELDERNVENTRAAGTIARLERDFTTANNAFELAMKQLADCQSREAKALEELAQSERDCLHEIYNRDIREQVINDLCAAVGHRLGFDFEWSSHYGFTEAVGDVTDIFAALQADRDQLQAQAGALRGALEVLRDNSIPGDFNYDTADAALARAGSPAPAAPDSVKGAQ